MQIAATENNNVVVWENKISPAPVPIATIDCTVQGLVLAFKNPVVPVHIMPPIPRPKSKVL